MIGDWTPDALWKFIRNRILSDPAVWPKPGKTMQSALQVEPWHEVAVFAGTWVNFGGILSTAAFLKDPFGWVHLKGLVKSGAGLIFTLPEGYRPAQTQTFTVSANAAYGEISIAATGTVTLSAGSNVYISLDNIRFRAA